MPRGSEPSRVCRGAPGRDVEPPRAGKSSRRRCELGPVGFLSLLLEDGRDEPPELVGREDEDGREEGERGVEGRSVGGREFLRSSISISSLYLFS